MNGVSFIDGKIWKLWESLEKKIVAFDVRSMLFQQNDFTVTKASETIFSYEKFENFLAEKSIFFCFWRFNMTVSLATHQEKQLFYKKGWKIRNSLQRRQYGTKLVRFDISKKILTRRFYSQHSIAKHGWEFYWNIGT